MNMTTSASCSIDPDSRRSESIGFFSPERARFLEYDLTRTIFGLSNPKRPVLTVVSAYPLEWGPGGIQGAMRGQSRPYGIMQPMQEFFDVRVASKNFTEIEPETDVLMLLHARDLTRAQMYAIDQFIVKNGKALIFADPFSETGAALPPTQGTPSPLDRHESLPTPLFKAGGVEVESVTWPPSPSCPSIGVDEVGAPSPLWLQEEVTCTS